MFVLISVLIQTLLLSCQPVHPVPEKNTEAIPSGPVYQSKDGGQSWTGFGKGLPTDFVASDLAFFDGELYAGSELGIFHTTAGAAHSDWKRTSDAGDQYPLLPYTEGIIRQQIHGGSVSENERCRHLDSPASKFKRQIRSRARWLRS